MLTKTFNIRRHDMAFGCALRLSTTMRIALYLVFILALGACTSETVRVYEDTGERQCEESGIKLPESRAKLEDAGVEVLNSQCGIRTGIAVPAVCGGPTVNIHTHQINTNDIEKAKALGFEDISRLVDEERQTGYELGRC